LHKLEKGVNLGGWFSQCDYTEERFLNFITEKDFKELKKWGIDHVRIPVDYNLVETEEGEYKESGFSHLERAIGWCKKYGFNIVLDLHKTAGYCFDFDAGSKTFFDDEALQERFYRLWEEFARRFLSYSDMMAFELLNEITDPSSAEKWNVISKKAIERIRAISKEVTILVGGCNNNHISSLRSLDMPYDENIIYNFHCYEPMIFTHQHAYWSSDLKQLPDDVHITYPDTVSDYVNTIEKHIKDPDFYLDYSKTGVEKMGTDFFEELFCDGLKVAKERGVRLYCGEYGVIDQADLGSTLNWYRDIHAVFEKYGIGRAAWTYKEMDFGLSDERMEPIRDEIISCL
jgi:aryl-phospho-beta-D-glucosidase BglC (GH1 family)